MGPGRGKGDNDLCPVCLKTSPNNIKCSLQRIVCQMQLRGAIKTIEFVGAMGGGQNGDTINGNKTRGRPGEGGRSEA